MQTPIIRRKYPSMATITTSFSDESAASTLSSDDSSMSTEPTDMSQLGPGGSMFSASSATINAAKQNIVPSAWRKPQQSQRRTRERMVSVLKGLGQNVGLPRSPSVSRIMVHNLLCRSYVRGSYSNCHRNTLHHTISIPGSLLIVPPLFKSHSLNCLMYLVFYLQVYTI